jgi:hypothetical protein
MSAKNRAERDEEYSKVEEAHAKEVDQRKAEEANKENVIFFHMASKGQLGGWRAEERLPSGHINKREAPLRFDENLYVTGDPEEIEFIRNHPSFNVHCFECKDMNDAERRRTEQLMTKQKRSVSVDLDIRADGLATDGETIKAE